MKFGIVPVMLVPAHLSMKSVPDFLACRGFESKVMAVQMALIEKAPSFAYEKPIP